MTGQLLAELALRHDVGALYLRARGEPDISESLRDALIFAEEVPRPASPSTVAGRAAELIRRSAGLMAGRPVWVTDWAVPAFGVRAGAVASAWQPHVIQAELHVMGQYLAELGALATPRVLVDHDPGAAATVDLAGWERGWRRLGRHADGVAWRRYERHLLGDVDVAVVFTETDRSALLERCPHARVVRISPGIALPTQPLDALGSDPPRVLFLGSFVHPPNVEAAVRLGRDIFPGVRDRLPTASLDIVGDAPPPEVRRLAGKGVAVTGRVDDVSPYLNRTAVVAAPLRLGGGMRVKVLETLAAGKALVATPRALAGIDLTPGHHALVRENDAEFRDALVYLLADPDARARLARAGRAWAEQNLGWSPVVAAYESLYESLLDAGGHA